MLEKKLDIHMQNKIKLDPYPTPHTKINSEWVKNFKDQTRCQKTSRRKPREKAP